LAIALSANLIVILVRREIAGRYRGSMLGLLWSMLTPLFMLAVYTFVFGVVLRARWAAEGAQSAAGAGTSEPSTAEFAIILFAGLIVFQLFAEVISRAPTLILSNTNYVKKVVFPLEILPAIALGSALFHAGVSFVVLLVFRLFVLGVIPITVLLLPLVLAPFCLVILGLSWFIAALGVYYRDINQFLGTLITALLFLSPIFFPLSALPEWLRPWVALNPLSVPVEATRAVLIFGTFPDFASLGAYSAFGIAIATLGYAWFQKTRKGFADVL
jgi:homopolymeric O-antigen transport system permease protein